LDRRKHLNLRWPNPLGEFSRKVRNPTSYLRLSILALGLAVRKPGKKLQLFTPEAKLTTNQQWFLPKAIVTGVGVWQLATPYVLSEDFPSPQVQNASTIYSV